MTDSGGARSCPVEAIKKVKKGTLLKPKVPQTSGPKVAPHPVLPQGTPPALPRSRGKKPHLTVGKLQGFGSKPLSLPCPPPASREKLLGGRNSQTQMATPQSRDKVITLPYSPGPCQFCWTPHLQLVSGLASVGTSWPWLQGDSGA